MKLTVGFLVAIVALILFDRGANWTATILIGLAMWELLFRPWWQSPTRWQSLAGALAEAGVLVVVLGIGATVHYKYKPTAAVEWVVGYYVLPGELLTGESYYPQAVRKVRSFMGEETDQTDAQTDAEVAHGLKTETLRGLVEQFNFPPDNPFRQELERRTAGEP